MLKIIDLLNKIANGDIPKKIKINNRIWEHDGIDYTRDSDGEYLFNVFLETTTHDLNMEVEILEEEKKIPEKIPLNYADDRKPEEVYEYLRCSYNQLIDYLKSKGDE